jgi:hypothetical protein
MEQSEKFHHYLVCGQVVFTVKDKENINAIFVNAVIHGSETVIPVRVLARAQQAVQVQFYERMQNPDIKVLDVVIMNMQYLGHMTKEEFQTPPENMEQQEVTEEESKPINLTLVPDTDTNNPYH